MLTPSMHILDSSSHLDFVHIVVSTATQDGFHRPVQRSISIIPYCTLRNLTSNKMAVPRGRGTGVPNYKNDVLITIVEAILPNCSAEWETVCRRYKIASEERVDRDAHDVKRHFMIHKSLCDSNKKVTGSAAPKPSVARCQAIFMKICRKGSAGCYGDGDEEETNDSDSGEDDESRHDIEVVQELADEPPADMVELVPAVVVDAAIPVPEKRAMVKKKRAVAEIEESGKFKNCRNKSRGEEGRGQPYRV